MAKKLRNSQLKIKTNVWFGVCIEKQVKKIQKLLCTGLEGWLCAMKLDSGLYLIFHEHTNFSRTVRDDVFDMLRIERKSNGTIQYHDIGIRQRSSSEICTHLNI